MSDSDDEEYENCLESLETFDETGMGTGVKTKNRLQKHTLIGEYKGSQLTYLEALEYMRNNRMHYIVKAHKDDVYINGDGPQGNILKYINHKCLNSNCELVKLSRTKVGIITKRVILPGESLNYDYNITYFEGVRKVTIKCNCHPDCPNFM
jgi:hypothetical protein